MKRGGAPRKKRRGCIPFPRGEEGAGSCFDRRAACFSLLSVFSIPNNGRNARLTTRFLVKNEKLIHPSLAAEAVAQLFEGVFFDAGNIGAGDAEALGGFLLGEGRAVVEAVAPDEDMLFALLELFAQSDGHALDADLELEVFGDGIFAGDDIDQGELVAFLIDVDDVVNGFISGAFFLRAEVHQDFIRYPLPTDT